MLKKLVALLTLGGIIKCCIDGDPYCARCGGDQCLMCYQSFRTVSGSCVAVEQNSISNCLIFKSINECEKCNFGYSLKDGQCVKISVQDCLSLNRDGVCEMCNNSVLVSEGKCDGGKCGLKNCAICTNNGEDKCYKCKEGLVLHPYVEDGKLYYHCAQQNSGTIGCRESVVNDASTCIECDVNFYYKNGRCVKSAYSNITLNFTSGAHILIAFLSTFLLW
jgi:hypothetical protein